uniref:Uncharacterized protein n=1 Tax=Leptobrachium leishanense TaxID=445787 RepID=A0A8C5QYS6_9ANUR
MALSPITLLGSMCLLSISGVLADDCEPYFGSDFRFHGKQVCILSFCSGSCLERSCSLLGSPLNQSQLLCIMNNLYMVLGLGILVILLIVGSVITCFCKSCCLCFQLCRQPDRSRISTRVEVTTAAPMMPIPYPVHGVPAGYQPVPHSPMYAGQPGKAYLPPPYPGEVNLAYVETQ